MASYNRVILVGNLTRDPELKHIPSGLAVTEIGLAVNDRVKKGEQWVDEATYVDITFFGRTAEVVSEYTSKGSPLFIEGRLKLDMWEKDGQKRSKMRVIGERVQLLSSKGDGGGGGQRSPGSRPAQQQSRGGGDEYSAPAPEYSSFGSPPDDEIPF